MECAVLVESQRWGHWNGSSSLQGAERGGLWSGLPWGMHGQLHSVLEINCMGQPAALGP